jgi:hypothetical protein
MRSINDVLVLKNIDKSIVMSKSVLQHKSLCYIIIKFRYTERERDES